MNSRRRAMDQALRVASALLLPGPAFASQDPAKLWQLVVPFPPGGANDLAARLLAPLLHVQLGEPISIRNYGGAGGALGVQQFISSPFTESSILLGSLSELVLAPLINPHLRYSHEDLWPIEMISQAEVLLLARPGWENASLKALQDQTRSRSMTCATIGVGSHGHLLVEALKQNLGLHLVHVPYRGAAAALSALAANQVDLAWVSDASALPFLNTQDVRAIASAGATRSMFMPELPTVSEIAALNWLDCRSWVGLFAHKSMPRHQYAKASKAVRATLTDQHYQQLMKGHRGFLNARIDGEAFVRFLNDQRRLYQEIVRQLPVSSMW